ncbi:hypothetical protein [Acinetobacter sp. G18]|uniref:hypothetical protein n=1 Tax=Acinetobacter sp. G18 TaxID=2952152 RepID=UPI0040445640
MTSKFLNAQRDDEANYWATYNYIMGFANGISLGLGQPISNWFYGFETADINSSAYSFGSLPSLVLSTIGGGVRSMTMAGAPAKGFEFSHWVPSRFVNTKQTESRISFLDNDFGKWLVQKGNKWNGNYVPTKTHALSDPFRYQFMPKTFKEVNAMPSTYIQQYNRIPLVYKGAIVGGAYGSVGIIKND